MSLLKFLFKPKKDELIDNPYFRHMMYGGGYEDMIENRKREDIEYTQALSEFTNAAVPCKYCGAKDVKLRKHADRDGHSCWCQCGNCENNSPHIFGSGDEIIGVKMAFIKWNEKHDFNKG